MFIVAQRVGVTVHKKTNVSFANAKLLGVSEEVVWIIVDFCYRSILLKTFLIKVAITNCFSSITKCGFEDFTRFNIFLIMIFLSW